ncbi:MAG: VWA domain-containing protein [Sphingomonadaceae bacterium]|uniref:vWA domain-containing protein n=1 Tax=Thermaurantiacus sp. TaxID=2820283 RepID=UPI00298F16E5|nr:VWA domain-containing protein [Thermaurantiacus sp.]MCS6986353.1 VWA domain-containing protein [Sphingomonadaceae bacterium]MDW8414385.1 VWA domain-containing protein [Thermaurantiacus sp.]
MTLTLALVPRRAALLAGRDQRLEVLVRASAGPAPDGHRRPRLNLALVIDRSGSMSGRPLEEAKRLACRMIERLTADDHVSVVAYDDRVHVVAPVQPAGDPNRFRPAVMAIDSGGCTALQAGWAAGAEQAARRLDRADLSRVLLLSDGCANVGETDPTVLADQCRRMAAAGVSTSTYGLANEFNEHLMTAMARAGGGIARYGVTAADLAEPFDEEFELLSALAARRVRVALTPGPGVGLDVLGGLPHEDGGWCLPDIAFGAAAWALVRLDVPAALTGEGPDRPVPLLQAHLKWQDPEGRPAHDEARLLALPALPWAAYQAVPEDPEVVRRVDELRFAEVERQAAEAARLGDWPAVERALEVARDIARDHPWLQASLRTIEELAHRRERERLAKEAFYGAAARSARLVDPDPFMELRGFDPNVEAARPAFLRRKAEQGRNLRPIDPDLDEPTDPTTDPDESPEGLGDAIRRRLRRRRPKGPPASQR